MGSILLAGAAAGDTAAHPGAHVTLQPRGCSRFSIRLRGNASFILLAFILVASPAAPGTPQLGPLPSITHPSTPKLRCMGRGECGDQLVLHPWVSLGPSLGGVWGQRGFGAAQRHQRGSSGLQTSHLPSWTSAASPDSTVPCVGGFSVCSQLGIFRTGCHQAAGTTERSPAQHKVPQHHQHLGGCSGTSTVGTPVRCSPWKRAPYCPHWGHRVPAPH